MLSKTKAWLASALLLSSVLATQAQGQEQDPELTAALKQAFASADSFIDRFDAEVWLVDQGGRLSPHVKDPLERIAILKAVHAEASRQQLDPALILGLIHTESRFDRFAISSHGALGLMQIMPFWRDEIGRSGDNLTDIETNVRYGCAILKHYLKRAKGDMIEALARYNGSLGRLKYPRKVLRLTRLYQ